MKYNVNFDLPDNATLTITPKGMKLSVSLNIPKKACKFDKKAYCGTKVGTIFTSCKLNQSDFEYSMMWILYKTAIKRLKIRARLLKIELIKSEIKTIKQYKLNL